MRNTRFIDYSAWSAVQRNVNSVRFFNAHEKNFSKDDYYYYYYSGSFVQFLPTTVSENLKTWKGCCIEGVLLFCFLVKVLSSKKKRKKARKENHRVQKIKSSLNKPSLKKTRNLCRITTLWWPRCAVHHVLICISFSCKHIPCFYRVIAQVTQARKWASLVRTTVRKSRNIRICIEKRLYSKAYKMFPWEPRKHRRNPGSQSTSVLWHKLYRSLTGYATHYLFCCE